MYAKGDKARAGRYPRSARTFFSPQAVRRGARNQSRRRWDLGSGKPATRWHQQGAQTNGAGGPSRRCRRSTFRGFGMVSSLPARRNAKAAGDRRPDRPRNITPAPA
jgi:hypothetical protein